MDQPRYGCQSCSWSAEQGKCFFPCPGSRLGIDCAKRVRLSCPTPARSFSTLRVVSVLTHGVPLAFRGGVISFISFIHKTATGSVPSLSGWAFAYRWRSPPRVSRHRASSLKGSLSNVYCLFMYRHGPINVRLSFPIDVIGAERTCATHTVSDQTAV